MSGITKLAGKVAIVTGGGRGLGRAHALALADAGAAVVVNDIGGSGRGEGVDTAVAQTVVDEIVRKGGRAVANATDLADWAATKELVEVAIATFGGLDIVVNNAGISRFAPIDALTQQDWERTLAVNLTGTAALIHWAARAWREAGPQAGRAVVNTGSPAGTNPLPGSPAYCAAKAGVAALTITSAAELASLGVRVNAIAPMARTRLTEAVPFLEEVMRKPETGFDRVAPENVAPLVVWLAGPDCDFTGRVFGVEGDDIYLFDGWSASQHVGNGGKPWTDEALGTALREADRRDRGYMIAPSARIAAPQPSDETVAALAALGGRA
ncbi:SDR family NAD(P)-dependent oxidoreductase [Sphingomonas profundi]|uniref:SDR family NAD(P)-dependent oxidoreductase n=1 Tax=Alterirhizorhabdus profundi TaxID=2681549 RepID=UPI0018D1C174|nr:SDR family NAD(P)-dependent oxidoreductase [Sphingomonas profundi]